MTRKKHNRIYNWLTTKYQLIIRNEADFSEKTTISYNYGKALTFFFLLFSVSAVVGYFSIRYVDSLLTNRGDQKDLAQEVVRMSEEIKSLKKLTKSYKDNDKALQELMNLIDEDDSNSLKK